MLNLTVREDEQTMKGVESICLKEKLTIKYSWWLFLGSDVTDIDIASQELETMAVTTNGCEFYFCLP